MYWCKQKRKWLTTEQMKGDGCMNKQIYGRSEQACPALLFVFDMMEGI